MSQCPTVPVAQAPAEAADPAGLPLAIPPTAPPRVRRLCLVGLLLFVGHLVGFGAVAIYRQSPDFEYFYKGSRFLIDHGTRDAGYDLLPNGAREARGGIEWYLPVVPRLLTLLSWMPLRAAGAVWLLLNAAAFVATIRLVGKHVMGLPPDDWPVTTLVPVLVLGLFWHWEFRLNQIDTLTLLLLTASFVLWQRGRFGVAGFWLGLATLLKLTPGLLVFWFALKRQWRTVGVALATIVLAGPLSDAAALGPSYTAEWYGAWARQTLVGSSQGGLILAQREMDWRNQSLGAVLSRWLHPTNYATHFDNDPRIRFDDPPATMNVAELSTRQVAGVATLVAVATLVVLTWLARRHPSVQPLWQLRVEWALFVLAMLWFMPVMRRYHLIWATPAVVVLAGAVHYLGRESRTARLALVSILLTVLLQAALLTRSVYHSNVLEAGGVLLAVVPVLALPLVVLHRRLSRAPQRLPVSVHDPQHPLSRLALG